MMMQIDDVQVGQRHRHDMGNIDGLARSIAELGLLHPIVVTPSGELIAGGRRLAACRQLGWLEVPVTVVDLAEIIRGELAENTERKDFLPSEIDAIRRAHAQFVKTPEGRPKTMETFHSIEAAVAAATAPVTTAGTTRDKIGAFAGVSGRTVDKIAKVVEAAEREPERFGPLVTEMDRTRRVNGVYKKLVVARKAAAINAEPVPLPAGPYHVIVADPPWQFEVRANDPSHRAASPYPDMTSDEIAAMPVCGLAHDDSILWLWTTNAHFPQALKVVEAWGFTYKTMLTWAKDRMGLGLVLRGQTEQCIVAFRGRPALTLTNQTTLLYAPLREHSRKPDEFYSMVEALCPGSKVELFSREPRVGWAVHGDEVQIRAAE